MKTKKILIGTAVALAVLAISLIAFMSIDNRRAVGFSVKNGFPELDGTLPPPYPMGIEETGEEISFVYYADTESTPAKKWGPHTITLETNSIAAELPYDRLRLLQGEVEFSIAPTSLEHTITIEALIYRIHPDNSVFTLRLDNASTIFIQSSSGVLTIEGPGQQWRVASGESLILKPPEDLEIPEMPLDRSPPYIRKLPNQLWWIKPPVTRADAFNLRADTEVYLKEHPNNESLLFLHADCLGRTGKWSEALHLYQRLIYLPKLLTERFRAIFLSALALQNLGDHHMAIAYFEYYISTKFTPLKSEAKIHLEKSRQALGIKTNITRNAKGSKP